MNDIKDIQNIISEIKGRLSTVLYSKNLEFAVVRLLFLKYVIDNYIGATTVDNMQLCARAQKMFAMRDVENGMDIIVPVLKYIDESYGFENILSNYDNLDEYARELFGENQTRQRKNVVSDDFKTVMDVLGSIDLEERNDGKTLGKMLTEVLIDNINVNAYRNSFSGECTTRPNLSKLASRLLLVESNEVFLDFASGIGLSTVEITKKTMPKIINAEINSGTLAISAMLYIMYGYKSVKLICGDSLTDVIEGASGDKIFVDVPLGARLRKSETNEYTESSLAAIYRILHNYLSENSKSVAVIAIPSSPLFTIKKQNVELRKELLSKGLLKAVIALPPMWRGSSVGTNLLVISRERNETVMLVNASETSATSREKLTDISGEVLLSEDKIDSIVRAVNCGEIIEGFSTVVTAEDIAAKDYNFVPATYIVVNDEEDSMTLAEIDSKLKILYDKLLD